jgi:hypothetical protein
VAAQVVAFARQVVIDGTLGASVEERCLVGTVEIAVEIDRFVENFDIARWRWPLFDGVRQRTRMRAQRVAVIVNPVEHDGRDK